MLRSFIFLLSLFFITFIHAKANLVTQSLLKDALLISRDSNGQSLFLCRAYLFGGMQIGTISSESQHCILTYEGKIHYVTEFSIPNKMEFGLYTWSTKKGNAISVGTNSEGKPIYLCKSYFNGVLLSGTTWLGYNHCNVAYKGTELIADITYILSSLR